MITKEKFIYYMDELIRKHKELNSLYDAVENITGAIPDTLIDTTNESLEIELLKELVEDKENWIDWFIFECDCGDNNDFAQVVDRNGKEIPVKNSKDLWNLIKEC